ncbi:dihydropteroate synthase [Bartonella tamiae]|uniref:Dihydropteroate synthase n=1 Tax=Bartonella tamiae Th239 TaxID=1094558 RepID=J0ZKE0_9HYPH|nr:dihydropteroate synthase [Bartonella tamiae]EJF88823.1 dihydropteroate synthase [Bartonella tamiae Th239]EJF94927.1 dihydropteroate synthase [Bartonella tamiae Th307]
MQTIWNVGQNRKIIIQEKSILMGILNITPDSFSDGGKFIDVNDAFSHGAMMIEQGASIIDIGGESTRPNFEPISSEIEQKRILPVIEKFHSFQNIILSIDTYHSETAYHALKSGSHIINDIWGLQKEEKMAEVIREFNAGIIIMHNSRDRKKYEDIIDDQKYFFEISLNIAKKNGISDSQIVLDPGFGFGKNADDNLKLLSRAEELKILGFPLLAATSRKRFLGSLSDKSNAQHRDIATAASSIILRQAGFDIFRVHNIATNKEALAVVDALKQCKKENIK